VTKTVLVIGATGTQGGAVADHLLANDHDVHALTRSPESDAARALADRGATVVEGDLSDRAALTTAMADVDGVFLVTNFWEHGYEAEVQQGENAVDAAVEAGVDQFVFTSVGGAERDTGIPHFDSKYDIEQYLGAAVADTDLAHTVVRPVFFQQNLEANREDVLEEGVLALAMEPDVPLQMVDADDIGALVLRAVEAPERYDGEAIELASDELTLRAAAARVADVTGRDVRAQHLDPAVLEEAMGEFGTEYRVMFEWFNEYGYQAAIDELQADHDLDLTRLSEYLERAGWGEAN
jgi:uncharacterized protein YbjT (DUF2867 family)